MDTKWTEVARKQLQGRTIKHVRYMTDAEKEELGIYSRGIILQLDSGLLVYPMSDDEGNEAGALHTTDKNDWILPVLRG